MHPDTQHLFSRARARLDCQPWAILADALRRQSAAYIAADPPRIDQRRFNWILEQIRQWSRRVLTLAGWARISGDDRCREAAWVLIEDACSWERWSNEPTDRFDLGLGELSATAALLLDWLDDPADISRRQRYIRMLEERCLAGYLHHVDREHPIWWHRIHMNWGAVCNGGALALASSLPGNPAAERTVALARIGVEHYLDHGLNADGSSSESIGYWSYGLIYLTHAMLAHERLGGGRHPALDLPALINGPAFPLEFSPGQASLGFGDSNYFDPPGLLLAVLARTGRLDLASEWLARILRQAQLPVESLDPVRNFHPDEIFALLHAPDDAEHAVWTRQPVSIWPDCGWGAFTRGPLTLSLRGGSTNVPHALRELGAIALACDGTMLLGNFENWPYTAGWFNDSDPDRGSSRPLYWEDGTGSKNAQLFNGIGQVRLADGVWNAIPDGMHVDATAVYPWFVTRSERQVTVDAQGFLVSDQMAVERPSYLEVRFLSPGTFHPEPDGTWLVENQGRRARLRFTADRPIIIVPCTFPCSVATRPPVAALRVSTDEPRDGLHLQTYITPD